MMENVQTACTVRQIMLPWQRILEYMKNILMTLIQTMMLIQS